MVQKYVRWVSESNWAALRAEGFEFDKHIADRSQTELVWECTYLDYLENLREQFGKDNVLLGQAFNPETQSPDAEYGVLNRWMGVYIKRQ